MAGAGGAKLIVLSIFMFNNIPLSPFCPFMPTGPIGSKIKYNYYVELWTLVQ